MENLMLPVGRLVSGSLYNGFTTDAENRPLVYKSGPNVGQPRVDFYFAVAIAKGTESHWTQTPWGKAIYDVAVKAFPKGQYNAPDFAWKIDDGDSTIPNRNDKVNRDRPGYKGHWIVKLSSGYAPTIVNSTGTLPLIEKDHVKLGDYVEVYCSIAGNESTQTPGIFINHKVVAFAGFGERIEIGVDPASLGFGKTALPVGASSVPMAALPVAASVPVAPPVAAPVPAMPPVAAPVPAPYPDILMPPAAPVNKMTDKATFSYEQYKASGWTDELLIQHGLMLP